MNANVIAVYGGFYSAIAIVGVAMSLAGQPFLSLMALALGLLFTPRYHETPNVSTGRALTDAETKLQIVRRLTDHIESNEHADNACGDECPVPEILKQITQ